MIKWFGLNYVATDSLQSRCNRWCVLVSIGASKRRSVLLIPHTVMEMSKYVFHKGAIYRYVGILSVVV